MAEINWAAIKERKTLLYIGSSPIDCKFLSEGVKVDTFEFRFDVESEGEKQTLVTKSGRFLEQLSEYVPLTGKVLRLSKTQKTMGGKNTFSIEQIGAKEILNEKHGKKSKK